MRGTCMLCAQTAQLVNSHVIEGGTKDQPFEEL